MGLNFDSAEVTVTCPKCAHEFQETIGRLKDDPKIPCPGCGVVLNFESKGLRDGIEEVEESVEDFRRSIGKMLK